MLISIRRVAAAIVSHSRFPPDRSQSRRVLLLLPHSTLTSRREPRSMLETFKDHGFTDAQIDVVARKAPWIRSSRSGDLVGSKLSYLCRELGLDPSDLVKVVTSDPAVLTRSLENTIVPSVNYLESMLGSRCRVIPVILRSPWLLRHTISRVAANISVLKDSGVPDPSIMKVLLKQSCKLIYLTPERLRSLLDSMISAEFDASKPMFVHAVNVKSSMSSATWEKKVGVYRSFGWSAEEAELAFRRCPALYAYSEERLRRHLDFAKNVLGMQPAEVLVHVKIVTNSLEGSLIPRCCVLNVLMGKKLVKKDMNVPNALCKNKQEFARLFVEKYRDRAPEVLDAYQGKMRFSGFDCRR